MEKSYVRIIQAIALGAAILGLLLSTPSLEARTRHSVSKKHKAKKMKITFDGSEPAPQDQGELGDEIVQPKMTARQMNDPREVVHMRGTNVDDSHIPKKAKQIQHQAGPDLIAGPDDVNVDERAHSAHRTTIGDSLTVDESALGSFKKTASRKSVATKKQVASSRPDPVEDSIPDSLTDDSVAPVRPARMAVAEAPVAHSAPAVSKRMTHLVLNPSVHTAAKPAILQAPPVSKPTFVATSASTLRKDDGLDFDAAPVPAPVHASASIPVSRATPPPPRAARPAPQFVTKPAKYDAIDAEFGQKQVQAEPVQPRTRSRIYMRDVQPVLHQSSMATNMRQSNEPSDLKFDFAFENTTSGGRKYELETPGGRNYMMKNEIFVGTTHTSGWGADVSFNYLLTSNDDSTKDIHELGDPSLIVKHPSLYKDANFNLTGQGRVYLPLAPHSKSVGLYQLAYYLIADFKLADGFNVNNSFVPRYYQQSQYADSDAFSLIYDTTELTKSFDSFLVGFGQRTQIESHQAVAPGTSVEAYPFVGYTGISNTLLEAKAYIPAVVSGLVNGVPGSPEGPTSAGLSNFQLEFFARIAF